MAEQNRIESGDDQTRDEDVQLVELGQGETGDDNQLQSFAGMRELAEVMGGSKGNTIIALYQPQMTHHHTTQITGDIVKGEKFDIKDAKNIGKIEIGNNQTSKPQEMPETPRNQRYIDEARDYESDDEPGGSTMQSREKSQPKKQIREASGGARRKTSHSHRPYRSSNTTDDDFYRLRRDVGQMQLEEYDDTTENLSMEDYENLQTRSSAIYGREKFSQTPLAIDSQSQTEETITRTTAIQTDKKISYPTEMQTDEIITRDRMLQTEMEVMVDSDSQTATQYPHDHQKASSSLQIDAYSQTVKKLSLDILVQTDNLQLSTNETQTEIKLYLDNEIQTDEIQTVSSLTQTSANAETMPGIHTVVMEAFHEFAHRDEDAAELEILKLYEDEDTSQNLSDFQLLFTIVWKSIQFKIVKKSFERHQTSGQKLSSLFANTCLKFISEYNKANDEDELIFEYISRVKDIFKLGLKFKSENKPIHAIVTFYAAAKLQKLKNNKNDSVYGVAQCVEQVRLVVAIMTKQLEMRKIVLEYIISLLIELKNMLVTIKNTTDEYLVESEAACLYHIALCYSCCNEYEQYINMNESAIELMRRHFKDEAEKYGIYGICLNNAGAGFERMGKTEKAVEYYEMALKAYEKATDWINDEQKNKSIALAERNLKRAKEELRK